MSTKARKRVNASCRVSLRPAQTWPMRRSLLSRAYQIELLEEIARGKVRIDYSFVPSPAPKEQA